MYKLFIEKNISSADLIKKVLNELGIQKYEIVKNKYGYPYLKDIDNLYFNISNKDDYVVCAISDKKIGVDIERFTFKKRVMDNYFTLEEKEYILKSKDRDRAFTKIWVMKESYVKMLGIGLSYGLKEVDTFILHDYFHIKMIDNYYICICIDPSI